MRMLFLEKWYPVNQEVMTLVSTDATNVNKEMTKKVTQEKTTVTIVNLQLKELQTIALGFPLLKYNTERKWFLTSYRWTIWLIIRRFGRSDSLMIQSMIGIMICGSIVILLRILLLRNKRISF